MPQLFNGVHIRTFWWCSPPVDTIVFEKFPCSRCMFRVVLHEPVTTRIISLQTWEQCILEDLDVKTCIHPPFKIADVCWAIPADSSPNVDLHWVFGLGLQTGWLTCFTATESLVWLQLNSCLISPNNIMKIVVKVQLSPLQMFLLVYLSNKLTIGWSSKSE